MSSADILKFVPNLKALLARFREDEDLFVHALEKQQLQAKQCDATFARSNVYYVGGEVRELSAEQLKLNESVLQVVDKLNAHGEDATFTEEDEPGLQAIVRVWGRPALFISNGDFLPNPVGGQWGILDAYRDPIRTTIRSVGRIEVTDFLGKHWFGTGFVVGDDVVMTNRHVADEFCYQDEDGEWHFDEDTKAFIDFNEEIGAEVSAEFELTKIIGIVADDNIDLALFRMAKTHPTVEAPPPLPIASCATCYQEGQNVYVVGYPAFDPSYSPAEQERVFGSHFQIKRLQPGKSTGLHTEHDWLMHDCSTLNGNSGSPVVDLATNEVLGLHFKGLEGQANYAVALWQIIDHPLLVRANLNFV